MFGIGFGEFIIIAIVLIVAVGPDKLPTLMKTVGKTMRQVRETSRDLRSSIGLDDLMREDLLRDRPKPVRSLEPPRQQIARSSGASGGDAAGGDAIGSDLAGDDAQIVDSPPVADAPPGDPAKGSQS